MQIIKGAYTNCNNCGITLEEDDKDKYIIVFHNSPAVDLCGNCFRILKDMILKEEYEDVK
jgi:hypothetical protein